MRSKGLCATLATSSATVSTTKPISLLSHPSNPKRFLSSYRRIDQCSSRKADANGLEQLASCRQLVPSSEYLA